MDADMMAAQVMLQAAPGWMWAIIAGVFFALDAILHRSAFLWLAIATLGTAYFSATLPLNWAEQMSMFATLSWMSVAWWWLRNRQEQDIAQLQTQSSNNA